jgi:hypothetical protein
MTQEAFSTARDKIAEALNVIADSLMDEAEGEADPRTLLTLQGMLNDTIKATLSLRSDDVEAVGWQLDWLNVDDDGDDVQARIAAMEAYSEQVCSCDECAAKRGGMSA